MPAVEVEGSYVSGAYDGSVLETRPDVAALTGGGFVVVWNDANSTGDADGGIRFSIYANDGTGNSSQQDILANTTTAGLQDGAAVTALNDGGFLVVWHDENLNDIRGQRFDSSGTAVGNQFVMTSDVAANAVPDLATLADGRVAMTYPGGAVAGSIWDPRDSFIYGTSGDDHIVSRVDGAFILGGAGADTLVGVGGDDTLDGGADRDTETGGAGADRFQFDSPSDGIDTITDFNNFQGDKIVLVATGFALLGNGSLADSGVDFVLGNTPRSGAPTILAAGESFSFDQTEPAPRPPVSWPPSMASAPVTPTLPGSVPRAGRRWRPATSTMTAAPMCCGSTIPTAPPRPG